MPITTHQQGNATIIRVEGRLDIASSPGFESEAAALLGNGSTLFVFDCAGVNYVSSAGLRAFLVLHKRLAAAGHKLRLCQLQAPVRQVFDMSGFSDIFDVRGKLEESLG